MESPVVNLPIILQASMFDFTFNISYVLGWWMSYGVDGGLLD